MYGILNLLLNQIGEWSVDESKFYEHKHERFQFFKAKYAV